MINKTDSGQFRVFSKRQFQSECKASFHKNVPKAQVVSKTTLECPGGKYVIVDEKRKLSYLGRSKKNPTPPPPLPKKGTSDRASRNIFQRSRQKFEPPSDANFKGSDNKKLGYRNLSLHRGRGSEFFSECPIMSYFYLNPVLMRSFSPCDLNSMSGSSGD